MSADPRARRNPYVGPRAFQGGEPLFGRDREVQHLLDLLIAERIVLLYSPSGAGKTSLIQAALLPRLAEEGFRALPVIRLSLPPPPNLPRERRYNRFILSALSCLEEPLAPAQRTSADELAELSLGTWFERHSQEGDPRRGHSVLVFDQFEEIFTIEPHDRKAKEDFFNQVGALLRDRDRWALFAMREDYLGGLEPFLRAIPTRLKSTFRLDLLGEQAARVAIQEPAQREGVDFTSAIAGKLVDDLRRVRVQLPDGTTEEHLGHYVEPVQLQVVCRGLWARLPETATRIEASDVEAVGATDTALARYYAERIAAIAAETKMSERIIRGWFEHQLILEGEIRGQVLREKGESGGLSNEVIERLVGTHLVRAESRSNRIWYELAHDRLIKPIQHDNQAWFEQHLSALQRHAQLWHKHDRLASLLLRGEALAEAERWATLHPGQMGPEELEFLEECRKARSQAEKERRHTRQIRLLVSLLLAVALAAAAAFYQARRRALQSEARVISDAFSAMALTHTYTRPDQAAAWSVARLRVDPENVLLRSSLLSVLMANSHVSWYRRHATTTVGALAFSPDGELLASGGYDQRVVLWNASGLRLYTLKQDSNVFGLAFSPDGQLLAVAGSDGKVSLWNVDSRERTELPGGHQGMVFDVAFSSKGLLASCGEDGTVRRWDVHTGRAVGPPLSQKGWVRSVAFSPDGSMLASAGEDGHVHLWDASTGEKLRELASQGAAIRSLGFDPGGQYLAAGTASGEVWLWNLRAAGLPPQALREIHVGAITRLAFTRRGQKLIIAGEEKAIIVWDVATQTRDEKKIQMKKWGRPSSLTAATASGLRADPSTKDDELIAWGDETGMITLWSVKPASRLWQQGLRPPQTSGNLRIALAPDGTLASADAKELALRTGELHEPLGPPLSDARDSLVTPTFTRDGKRLAFATGGQVLAWEVATRKPLTLPPTHHGSKVTSLAFNADGSLLASGSLNGSVQLWSPGSGIPVGPPLVDPMGGKILSVAFSPDGNLLAAGNDKGAITLWDVARHSRWGDPLWQHNGRINALAFSQDGEVLASGGEDTSIILWDVASMQAKDRLLSHTRAVTALVFENGWLISSSEDDTAILWNVENDAPLGRPLEAQAGGVTSLAVSSGGEWLLLGGRNGALVYWNIHPEQWVDAACRLVGRNLSQQEWETVHKPSHAIAEQYRTACPYGLLQSAHDAHIDGKPDEARATYQALVSRNKDSSDIELENEICMIGAFDGYAREVMESCDQALERAPDVVKGYVHDSRGMARALARDFHGAIQDFQKFLEWARANSDFQQRHNRDELVAKRERWIAELQNNRNPFDDPGTLSSLLRKGE